MTLVTFKNSRVKRIFNPKNVEDLKVYKHFVKTGGWGPEGCPFELEWPHKSIPDMLAKKISEFAVSRV